MIEKCNACLLFLYVYLSRGKKKGKKKKKWVKRKKTGVRVLGGENYLKVVSLLMNIYHVMISNNQNIFNYYHMESI